MVSILGGVRFVSFENLNSKLKYSRQPEKKNELAGLSNGNDDNHKRPDTDDYIDKLSIKLSKLMQTDDVR